MRNNSLVSEKRNTEFAEEETPIRWIVKILIPIPSFMLLGGAISIIQNIHKIFVNDIHKAIFIDNWIPWIAILFFAIGWFTARWVEISLLKKQIRFARALFLIVLLGSALVSIYFSFFINYEEVLHHFGIAAQFLVYSGYFLRYPVFNNKRLINNNVQ